MSKEALGARINTQQLGKQSYEEALPGLSEASNKKWVSYTGDKIQD